VCVCVCVCVIIHHRELKFIQTPVIVGIMDVKGLSDFVVRLEVHEPMRACVLYFFFLGGLRQRSERFRRTSRGTWASAHPTENTFCMFREHILYVYRHILYIIYLYRYMGQLTFCREHILYVS
jgi:hypothetical protein